jgi:cytochrome P450
LIAVGCAALGSHPEQFGLLRRGAVSPDSAVEEFLRYDAPTQITARIVREPLELSGRRLNSGRVLLLLLGCANHDEAQFPEPGRLDLARSPNAHLSFGGGPHYCVGAGLARMEAATLFGRLATHLASLEANGGVEREPTATPRVYTRVPLGARAA